MNHVILIITGGLVLISALLKFVNLRQSNRTTTRFLIVSDLGLGLWVGISLLGSYISLDFWGTFLSYTFLSFAIYFMILFIEREMDMIAQTTIGSLLTGGVLLITYLQATQPVEFQLQMYYSMNSLLFALLLQRWMIMIGEHQELSSFYQFETNTSNPVPLLGLSILLVLGGLIVVFFTNTPSNTAIIYAILFTIISYSLSRDGIFSNGLNQKVYSVLYIINDKIVGYLELGEVKLLNIEEKKEMSEEFALALAGMSQMTSELTKSENKTAKLNYITSTSLFTEFYIIDESRYLVSIQERQSDRVHKQLVKIASTVDDRTEVEEFQSLVKQQFYIEA